MSLKNYYELLGIPPTASFDEVKRSFRVQIARYHPDKVHHLGEEFQAMAATRAAELTEAYRILSDETRRGEYDRAREAGGVLSSSTAAPPPPPTEPGPETQPRSAAPPPASEQAPPGQPPGGQFNQERASRDDFVRKATLARFKAALAATLASSHTQGSGRGFDLAWDPRPKLFARHKGPRVLASFVGHLDAAAVTETWSQATKLIGPSPDGVCVFVIGSSLARAGELATAIAEQRRKGRGANISLVPVDARDWSAHVPTDAPPLAKALLERLRQGGLPPTEPRVPIRRILVTYGAD